MARPTKTSFQSVPKSNQALLDEIEAVIKTQQGVPTTTSVEADDSHNSDIRAILTKLYTSICELHKYGGQPSTPDKTILAAWTSFLDPINRLAALQPHGDLLSARMVLYLTDGFISQLSLHRKFPSVPSSAAPIAMRCNFLVALDDALLSRLVRIWTRGSKRDDFNWVFTEHAVRGPCLHDHELDMVPEFPFFPRPDRVTTAALTRPSEMTPANGVIGRQIWMRPEGDATPWKRFPHASACSYSCEPDERDRLIMWQAVGSDGPIRDSYRYELVDRDSGEMSWRVRPVLRRSRQFVLDARKIAARNLDRERLRLGEVAMATSTLPNELRWQVLEYLEVPPPDNAYVDQLDLAAAYVPWPRLEAKCSACPARANKMPDKIARKTCPLRAITIWNLPLRAFQTWHETAFGSWRLCMEADCTGHHRDASWRVDSEEDLVRNMEDIIRARTRPDATLDDMGLGAVPDLVVSTREETEARRKRLFDKEWWEKDAEEEAKWTGLGGLVDVMVHDRTLVGIHQLERMVTNASWMLGRTRASESKIRGVCRQVHEHCHLC